jgi:hypothetical protein
VTVEIAVEAVAHEAAIALVVRQLVGECRSKRVLDPARHTRQPHRHRSKLLRQPERIRC